MAMASAAAISISTTLLKRPPLVVQPAMAASGSPTMMLHHRRRRSSLTTTCAAVVQTQGQGAVRRRGAGWTSVPVSSIGPANEDKTIFLITLDLSGAPDLADSYTTPGQYLLTRVPPDTPEKPQLRPAYMCISSAPRSGLHFDLLVRSVPGTTSEQLCKLQVGDQVELGPVRGKGFAIQHINPPPVAENVFLFAYAEGISPIRALIDYGFGASERADVRLFFADIDLQSMPYQDRFKKWRETGVNVDPLTQPIDESFLERNVLIVDPHSTGAIIVGPPSLREAVNGYLLDHDVPHDKILTIEWDPKDPFHKD